MLPKIDWNSPEVQASMKEHIVETERKEKFLDTWVVKKYFKKHKDHQVVDEAWTYFDALFADKTITCSCGLRYIVSRDMIDEAGEAYRKFLSKKKGKKK